MLVGPLLTMTIKLSPKTTEEPSLMSESNFRVVYDKVSSFHPAVRTLSHRQSRELDRMTGVSAPKTVDVSLKQIVPLLLDAHRTNRTWLCDFEDDTVRIDSDLYEVLLAYQRLGQRKTA